ncbi:hypothetical protein UCRNP2_7965 [Neofusicoccum parvum UCRNP2]|uniref:EKC/KEOPS complex subunit BUD32 n=1 Tax=Botryosphaeria parva (strain UCR-NP2) TaxID=1287680 RepID=R1G1K9_BOTPV|nr:hypothetical protein UCRNP2_7965 [Neofusicoccum parvum UCRNP2]
MDPFLGETSLRHDGRDGSIFATTLDGRPVALKKYHNDDAFCTETMAYDCIARCDALAGRVPRYHGPRASGSDKAILLELLREPDLARASQRLSSDELRRYHEQLRQTILLLHDQARLYHGDIRRENIIIQDGKALLLDFSAARLQADLDAGEWKEGKAGRPRRARLALPHVAVGLYLRDLVTAAAAPQHRPVDQTKVKQLLDIIHQPHRNLLAAVQECVPEPEPEVALALEKGLQTNSHHFSARNVLLACIKRTEQPSAPLSPRRRSDPSTDVLFILRHRAAQCAAFHEVLASPSAPGNSRPEQDASALFVAATDYFLAAHAENSPLHPTVLDLRLEHAVHVSYQLRPDDAAAICTEALDPLFGPGTADSNAPSTCGSSAVRHIAFLLETLVPRVGDGRLKERAECLLKRAREVGILVGDTDGER